MSEPLNNPTVVNGPGDGSSPVATAPWSNWIFIFIFVLALGHYLWAVSIGWHNPITDRHPFRQTQTAITAAYMVHQPLKLAYETPVLGPPWAVPMEFPLYQWIVVGVTEGSGMALEQAGRLVSIIFYLLILVPVYSVLGFFRVSPRHRMVALAFILTSPFYTFWSRSFLIETCGLFFAAAYLACAFKSGKSLWLALGCVAGVLAALVKITTFFPFWTFMSLFWAWEFVAPLRLKPRKLQLRPVIVAFLLLVVPVAFGVGWTHYADHVKEQNVVGHFITSKALTVWNFGSVAEKTSFKTWKTIFGRISDLCCQYKVFWCCCVVCLPLLPAIRNRWRETAACLLLFILAPIVFTHLHFNHDYYMCANGIFILGAISFAAIGVLESKKFHNLGLAIVAILIFSGIVKHQKDYRPIQKYSENPYLAIANQVREATPPEAVSVYLGFDWNSAAPYYSGRRALMIPDWNISTNELLRAFQNLKGEKTGLLVISQPNKWPRELILGLMKEAGLPEAKVLDCHIQN